VKQDRVLEPGERQNLLDLLRPPAGYGLDYAIGTTYTLDLMAMLIVPLSFTLFEWEAEGDRFEPDPLLLLEALRRHAERYHVFCQAGQIAVPRASRKLSSYLETSVHEVMPGDEQGVFHPKIWVLRFTERNERPRYRLLCLSRNLTFDRSWDTCVVLDGELTDRTNAFAANHPLGDFVAALPRLALHRLPRDTRRQMADISNELRRVRFELPPDFKDYRFWPIGIDGRRDWPFGGRVCRMLVVSPFLSENVLGQFGGDGTDNVIVSRAESLDLLDSDWAGTFGEAYYLPPEATPISDEESAMAEEEDAAPDTEINESPTGLHAKLYVADAGWDARVWTGSANATEAAFHRNVEFLVELRGKKSRYGIDRLTKHCDSETRLIDILEPYRPQAPPPVNAEREALEQTARQIRRDLAAANLTARVTRKRGSDSYRLSVKRSKSRKISLPKKTKVTCWPITLSRARAAEAKLRNLNIARFEPISCEALTSFFAFVVEVQGEEEAIESGFVLNLPLENSPQDRRERILRSLLTDSGQLMRFILLLLSETQAGVPDAMMEFQRIFSGGASEWSMAGQLPLFEALMRAICEDPARLERVDQLVDDLLQSEDGAGLLPEGFLEIWEPIRAAYQRISS